RNALVLILVEGDLSAVDHVKLATENGIPVVFMKGTGGLAGLLSIAMEMLNEKKTLELRTVLPTLFGIELENSEIDELDKSLRTIFKKSYLLDAFDVFVKNEEQFAASVGELVQKSWFLENTGHTEDKRGRGNKQSRENTNKEKFRVSCYAMPEKWQKKTITWYMAKEEPEILGFTAFSSPFSLPLDFFFRFSKFLELKRENPSSVEVVNEAQNLLKTALLTNRTDYVEALLDLNLPLSSDEGSGQGDRHISDLYKVSLCDYTERGKFSGMRWVLKAGCDIAIIPNLGYEPARQYSAKACRWLTWMSHQSGCHIRHARNGGEVPIGNYTVDGYQEATRTVYEFYGCYWHGCPTCYPRRKLILTGPNLLTNNYTRKPSEGLWI
ncbi:uncharacterized protein LOC134231602, partial [Saccostrea cucullata]|uniref:uncharacterized protein LOC134231602 n=1 Tax=Saccostrea cuccullata TaxID=36930 RepID=UPI002ED53D32